MQCQGKADPIAVGPHTLIKPSSWVWSMENIEVVWDENIYENIYENDESIWKSFLKVFGCFWQVPPLPSMVQTPAVASAPRAVTPPAASALLPMRSDQWQSCEQNWTERCVECCGDCYLLSDYLILSAYYLYSICIFAQKCDIHGKEFKNLKSTCVIRLSTSNCT